jgi:predicted RNA-binding Zn ribbon-like protein
MVDDDGTPAYVELLRAFANTLDVEEATDSIATRAQLTRWLHERGLLARRTPSTADDLDLAHRLRTGVRDAMTAHHCNHPVESADLTAATARLPLRMDCCGDGPRLEPVDGGVRGALARILVAVNESVIDDDWQRLKVCPNDTCQWAFYDGTKNRSKSWCGPDCGNKAKTRRYRQRQKAG